MARPIMDGYKDLEITYCRNCGSFLYKGKYISLSDFKKAFPNLLKNHISFRIKPVDFSVDTKCLDTLEKIKEVSVKVSSEIDGETIKEEGIMPVKFNPVECPFCSRLKGGYYEGILQLRNMKNSYFKEIVDKIHEKIDSTSTVAISDEMDVKGGMDFYITDKKFMQNLANELFNKYGGELKESPRLFSFDRQSSKKVYRMNVLLRLSEIEEGDIIKWKEELFKALSFSANKITAESLTTRKKRPIKIEDAKKVKDKKDSFEAIITKKKPHIEILHPKDYTSTTLENTPANKDKFNVVEIDQKLYAV